MEIEDFFKKCDKAISIFERPSASDNIKLLELAKCAVKYIEANPCDPDIYPSQYKAWVEYQNAVGNLKNDG